MTNAAPNRGRRRGRRGREVATEQGKPTDRLDWAVEGGDAGAGRRCQRAADAASADGGGVEIEERFERVHDGGDAARVVQVLDELRAGRPHIGHDRSAPEYLVDGADVELDSEAARDSHEMDKRVGRTAEAKGSYGMVGNPLDLVVERARSATTAEARPPALVTSSATAWSWSALRGPRGSPTNVLAVAETLIDELSRERIAIGAKPVIGMSGSSPRPTCPATAQGAATPRGR